MKPIDKLLKYLNDQNVAENVDDEKLHEIAECVVTGYEIDDMSRQHWLEINLAALKLIKTTDDTLPNNSEGSKDFPFSRSSKVVYPLIGPAVIQLAARLIQHVVRNNKVAECAVQGKDFPETNPQTGQPTGKGVKEAKAERVSAHMSYQLLIEDNNWLADEHKLNNIVAAWGVGFKEVYYDKISKKTCSDLLLPEDVIINNNLMGNLDNARRITMRLYLTKNDVISKIRSGEFIDQDLDRLKVGQISNESRANDSRDEQPVYEFLRQLCYLDLDDDEYCEPYFVWVHNQSKTLFGIYPAFEYEDIKIDSKGQIIQIKARHGVVDRHLIDDPEGKFYSLGLNHTLYHSAKGITSTLRQLMDAGTLSNAAKVSGFVTDLVQTKERMLRPSLGEYIKVKLPADVDIRTQFMPLPMGEPSQVLVELLQLQIDNAKQIGFMNDILSGEAETQNVPATTMLAQVEQGTRAFKIAIQKLYMSIKKELQIRFHLNSKYLDQQLYFKYQDQDQSIIGSDYDEGSVDICPVADPTQSSEAHKYARIQALIQILQYPAGQEGTNIQEALTAIYSGLEFPNYEQLVKPPSPPPPDPRMMDVQRKAQADQVTAKIETGKLGLQAKKLDIEKDKVAVKAAETGVKIHETQAKTAKLVVDAHKDAMDTTHSHQMDQHQLLVNHTNAHTDRITALAKAHVALNPPSTDTTNE